MDYAVHYGGKPVGKVRVTRQGLYDCYSCRCQIGGEIMYRLEVSDGERCADLGILVPMGDGFGITTRLPASRLGGGEKTFTLRAKTDVPSARFFVPIKPEEPFRYIARLKDAVLEIREGQIGASFPKK